MSEHNNTYLPSYYNENNDYLYETSYNRDNSEERKFFEIFGIKLYYDDLLIICILFFLYKENVHDEMLFITLILLLLS